MNKIQTRLQALEAIRLMAESSVNHYKIVNGDKRGNQIIAAQRELKAAHTLIVAMGFDASETELQSSLGW